MKSDGTYLHERMVLGIVVLTPRHPLKGASESSLSDRLSRLVQDGHRRFLIDLSDLASPSARDIGRLIRALASVRRAGCRICLCNLPESMLETLKSSRLDSMLNTYPTEADAIASLAMDKKTLLLPAAS